LSIEVREACFDPGYEYQKLADQCPDAGAVVMFIGKVRDLNQHAEVARLELSHYAGMTEASIESICDAASQQWQLSDFRVIHRVGRLAPKDPIVLVAVASPHRSEAFSACEFIMDRLKTEAAFWKKEIRSDGEHWLDMNTRDVARSERWNLRND
jgi:molybdopterin synthase catalytic subunit